MTARIRLLSSHSLQVWSTTWMNSIWRWWESGNTSTLFIFLQYKTAVAPSIWYTRWKPMQNPPHFIVLTLTSGQKSSAAKSVNFYTHGAENRREELGKKRKKKKRCQCLLFFDFLWDRCGDLDLERDFLADFLGVLERDLLDRLGVRGDDGDLNKKMAKNKQKMGIPRKANIKFVEYSGPGLHM